MAIICHCLGVRDRTITKAVQRGATTIGDVQALCEAGTECGGCHAAVADLIERTTRSAHVGMPRLVAHAG